MCDSAAKRKTVSANGINGLVAVKGTEASHELKCKTSELALLYKRKFTVINFRSGREFN